MMSEQGLSPNILQAISKVYSRAELQAMPTQQKRALDVMIQRVVDEHGADSITPAQIEGFKEMIEEHLYFPPTAPQR